MVKIFIRQLDKFNIENYFKNIEKIYSKYENRNPI